jgi:hypothetical protein
VCQLFTSQSGSAHCGPTVISAPAQLEPNPLTQLNSISASEGHKHQSAPARKQRPANRSEALRIQPPLYLMNLCKLRAMPMETMYSCHF